MINDGMETILEALPRWMSETRYKHTLRVAEVAVAIGQFWGLSSEKLLIAGLLHDIAKSLKAEDLNELGVQQNRLCRSIYDHYFSIWHAFIAPDIIKTVFKITDRQILSAVRWHTTGRPKMTPFEQVLYIADYIEPQRKVPNQDKITTLACQDLDAATFQVISQSLDYLKKKDGKIHSYSLHCFDYYEAITIS